MPSAQKESESYGKTFVPEGAPAWITAELIESTLAVWQPHYEQPLTTDDAVEILRSVGRLFDALGTSDEEVHCTGARLQP